MVGSRVELNCLRSLEEGPLRDCLLTPMKTAGLYDVPQERKNGVGSLILLDTGPLWRNEEIHSSLCVRQSVYNKIRHRCGHLCSSFKVGHELRVLDRPCSLAMVVSRGKP